MPGSATAPSWSRTAAERPSTRGSEARLGAPHVPRSQPHRQPGPGAAQAPGGRLRLRAPWRLAPPDRRLLGRAGRLAKYPAVADSLPAPLDRTLELANTPTRLKAMPDALQNLLVNWGYAAADVAIRAHVMNLKTEAGVAISGRFAVSRSAISAWTARTTARVRARRPIYTAVRFALMDPEPAGARARHPRLCGRTSARTRDEDILGNAPSRQRRRLHLD